MAASNKTPSTNTFGEFLNSLNTLNSLFGDRNQTFSQQPAADSLQSSAQAATNAIAEQRNLQGLAARDTAGLTAQSQQQRAGIDLNQARELKNMSASSGGSTSQGAGSFFNGQRILATTGQNLGLDQKGQNLWNFQRDQALQSTSMFGRANADVDIYRNNAIANNQTQNARIMADVNRYNQQLLNNQQFSQQSQLLNKQLAAQQALQSAQLGTQERVAQIAAQGNILGSLFGSVGVGSPSARYWN